MLPDVVQSDSKTNRADLCRPPLPPVHQIYFVKSRFELYFRFCCILIAGRINIGQLTLSSLFLFVDSCITCYVCAWLCAAWRFQMCFEQHRLQNYERRSWTSAFCVLFWCFCLRKSAFGLRSTKSKDPSSSTLPYRDFLFFPSENAKRGRQRYFYIGCIDLLCFSLRVAARHPEIAGGRGCDGPCQPRFLRVSRRDGSCRAATVQEGSTPNSRGSYLQIK